MVCYGSKRELILSFPDVQSPQVWFLLSKACDSITACVCCAVRVFLLLGTQSSIQSKRSWMCTLAHTSETEQEGGTFFIGLTHLCLLLHHSYTLLVIDFK